MPFRSNGASACILQDGADCGGETCPDAADADDERALVWTLLGEKFGGGDVLLRVEGIEFVTFRNLDREREIRSIVEDVESGQVRPFTLQAFAKRLRCKVRAARRILSGIRHSLFELSRMDEQSTHIIELPRSCAP